MYNKFDGYCMTGATKEDRDRIIELFEALDWESDDLTVDQYGRLWSAGGIYVADVTTTEPGEGILCGV